MLMIEIMTEKTEKTEIMIEMIEKKKRDEEILKTQFHIATPHSLPLGKRRLVKNAFYHQPPLSI